MKLLKETMTDCLPLNFCVCCGSRNLVSVLDLNHQPLANSYLQYPDEEESYYPLGINFCKDCTHVQLTHAVNPDLLFKNYLYVSGTTDTLKQYFNWFVKFVQKYSDGKKVLDIACNDGSQLDAFKANNYTTYGIDPAKNLYEHSSKNHTVVCDYLCDNSLRKLETEFDIMIAQNVFAHHCQPWGFLNHCKTYLKPGGKIFIQTSQADMIMNGQFDTIYHEHISFFSVKSIGALVKRAGLNLIDVVRTPVHGTSFVFVISVDGVDRTDELVKNEYLLTEDVMHQYADKCRKVAQETSDLIDALRRDNFTMVGYGAAAKGNTFLNFANINLDYIVDDNPLKTGLYTPGKKIPIHSPDYMLRDSTRKCIVPLAWNFFDEIKERVQKQEITNTVFLKYFPKLEIIN